MVDSDRLPRLTAGVTDDCKCQVPWHERPKWERLPYVSYVLPHATSPWQSHWEGHEHCWIACGCEDDGVLAQELASMEAALYANGLLLFASSVQSVLSGSKCDLLAAISNTQERVKNDQCAWPQKASQAIGKQGAAASDGKEDVHALSVTTHSTVEERVPSGFYEGICEDLLSWSSEGHASSIMDEEESFGAESDASEGESSKSEVKEPATLSEIRDGEEASADQDCDGVSSNSECFLESCPATPPKKVYADMETPEKLRFLEDDVDDFSAASDSSSCNKDFVVGGYCNDSECYDAW